MSRNYRPLAFTSDVIDAQVAYGSRAAVERFDRAYPGPEGLALPSQDRPHVADGGDPLSGAEREFLAGMDGFYLATVSETGWPYVQFRGGPPGFVTTPDEHTIAWPDFRGNRQYISTGNLAHDSRAAMIFMDYPRRARLKVYGHVRLTDVHRGESSAVTAALGAYRAKVEREVHVEVSAYDWNCPQHITPRYSAEELAPVLEPLRQRVADLEAENARLQTAQPQSTQ
jgi:predicted pyridoxine 5'-phosphate oxidase superfamily flavin-nucleotide-binding protein